MLNAKDFRNYRLQLGFSNQEKAKQFLAAKDIVPDVDINYLEQLKERVYRIARQINQIMPEQLQRDMEIFKRNVIDFAYGNFTDGGLVDRMTNSGRRKEEMTFSWLRGHAMLELFFPAIEQVFGGNEIKRIGDDSMDNISDFRKTPTADLELTNSLGRPIRIEVQSGFQGVNDIKQHKVLEARKNFEGDGIQTIVMHFDVFNGQVAFVSIDEIPSNDVRWATRPQMEGQTVFTIDQNSFLWLLTDQMPTTDLLEEELGIKI